jgi:hypothetical protein
MRQLTSDRRVGKRQNMINLNLGGLIGALAPLGVGILLAVLLGSKLNQEAITWGARTLIGAVVLGGLLGNFLWGRFVTKPQPKEPRDRQVMP